MIGQGQDEGGWLNLCNLPGGVSVPSNINIALGNMQRYRGQTMEKTKKAYCVCVLKRMNNVLHTVSIRLHPAPPHLPLLISLFFIC